MLKMIISGDNNTTKEIRTILRSILSKCVHGNYYIKIDIT